MRVLIVEDESTLRLQLKERFEAEGYVVDAAADGEEALYFGREYPIDLAIVDLGLPKLSGIEVITAWRKEQRSFPVLILTAKARWQEKVEGLEAGADDYLVKPFHIEELIARTKALLRRAAGRSDSRIACGELQLDISSQRVTVAGNPVELTAYEYRVLEYLMLHAGEVVSKSDLTEHIYAEDQDRDSNVIEVFVGRLRKKLDAFGAGRFIETLRNRGYRLTVE